MQQRKKWKYFITFESLIPKPKSIFCATMTGCLIILNKTHCYQCNYHPGVFFPFLFYFSWKLFCLQPKRNGGKKKKRPIFSLDRLVAVVSNFTSLVSCRILPVCTLWRYSKMELLGGYWYSLVSDQVGCAGHDTRMWISCNDRKSSPHPTASPHSPWAGSDFDTLHRPCGKFSIQSFTPSSFPVAAEQLSPAAAAQDPLGPGVAIKVKPKPTKGEGNPVYPVVWKSYCFVVQQYFKRSS